MEGLTKPELVDFLGRAAERLGVNPYEAGYHNFRAELVKQFFSTAYVPRPEKNKDEVLINLTNGTFVITAEKQYYGFLIGMIF